MVLEDIYGLWYRVLCMRYRQEGGACVLRGGDGLVWWQTMRNIREKIRQVGEG